MFNHFKPTPKKAIAGGSTPQNKQRTYIKFGYFLGDPIALARARYPKTDPIPAENPMPEPKLNQVPALIRPKKTVKKHPRAVICVKNLLFWVQISISQTANVALRLNYLVLCLILTHRNNIAVAGRKRMI